MVGGDDDTKAEATSPDSKPDDIGFAKNPKVDTKATNDANTSPAVPVVACDVEQSSSSEVGVDDTAAKPAESGNDTPANNVVA